MRIRHPIPSLFELVPAGIIEFMGHRPSLASQKTLGILPDADPCNKVTRNVILFSPKTMKAFRGEAFADWREVVAA